MGDRTTYRTCHLKGHLLKSGLTNIFACERCLEKGESAPYTLCDCEAIAFITRDTTLQNLVTIKTPLRGRYYTSGLKKLLPVVVQGPVKDHPLFIHSFKDITIDKFPGVNDFRLSGYDAIQFGIRVLEKRASSIFCPKD